MKCKLFISTLAVLTGLLIVVFPPASLSETQVKAAALAIGTITLWATGIIAEYLTALFFFLFAMLFAVSTPNVIFSGFAATATWLVFGGLILGIGINDTGLGNRIVVKMVAYLDGGYVRLISGVVAMGILFSFLMPSAIGRAILLTPIAVTIATHFGFKPGSNGRTGVLLAAVLGGLLPACGILPANVVNMVLAGMSETQFGISLLYGEYLLLHFPVMGLLKAVAIVVLVLWLFPDKPRLDPSGELIAVGPISKDESVLSVIIFVLLVFWLTDFIHHISPAWVALGGALILMIPCVNIVSRQQFNQKANFGSLFFVAGILGFGGMIRHTGLGDVLAGKLISLMPMAQGKPFMNYMWLSFTGMFSGIVATTAGVPAVLTPISEQISQVTGFPIKTVLMTQVPGFSTIIFPFQAPSIIVGFQMAGENLTTALKFGFLLGLITVFILWPLNYLWWHAIGWL